MRLHEDARRIVVFLGHLTTNEHGEIKPIFQGTAFFITHENFTYLVTARHVAEVLAGPFMIAYNDANGNIVKDDVDAAAWCYHEDESVEVAVTPATLTNAEWRAYPSTAFVSPRPNVPNPLSGPGDLVYIVGLYRLFPGQDKILPIVHTGHIAMLPDEPIPAWNRIKKKTSMVRGYLIEAQTLEGLSGSPVFMRYTTPTEIFTAHGRVAAYTDHVFLLGLWNGAWEGKAGQILAEQVGGELRVPVGMGITIPSRYILEILNSPTLSEARAKAKLAAASENAAVMDTSAC